MYELNIQLIGDRSKEYFQCDYSRAVREALLSAYYAFYVPKYGHMISSNTIQLGGGDPHHIDFEDNQFIVAIDYSMDSTVVHITDYTKQSNRCGLIIIYRETSEAIIHDLAYTPYCSKINLPVGGGTKLLRFMIYFIINYLKKAYNLDRILLTDNSIKYCDDCEYDTSLALTSVLLSGNTWYGKHGFRPYDSRRNEPSKTQLDNYQSNVDIMNKVRVKDVGLYDVIIKCLKNATKEKWFDHIKKHENDLLKNYLNKYIKYDCCALNCIAHKIYKNLFITDFRGSDFYLDI
jgi:hypothetical protein